MNGVPVYPVRQNGERPYPEGRKMLFSTPVLGLFPPPFRLPYPSCSSFNLYTFKYRIVIFNSINLLTPELPR